jgi:hypothetical protein
MVRPLCFKGGTEGRESNPYILGGRGSRFCVSAGHRCVAHWRYDVVWSKSRGGGYAASYRLVWK